MNKDNNNIYWLLKDKYNFSEPEILKFFQDSDYIRLLRQKFPRNDVEHTYENLKHDLKRIKNEEPVSLVIGWIEFNGLTINLNYPVLIPRPETEYWVLEEVKKIKNNTSKLSFLDLGCGSGCIGLTILKYIPNSHVTFSDISTDAMQQTIENLKANNFNNERFNVIQSDIYKDINEKFDYIFSNPPYVNPEGNIPESLNFEPAVALYSKNYGLEVPLKVIAGSGSHLNKNGKLFMEFGEMQTQEIEQFVIKNNINNFKFHKDQFNRTRYLELSN